MMRWVAGGASAVALVLALFFVWKSHAQARDPVPSAPLAAAAYTTPSQAGGQSVLPPAASERSREEKRFARADKNKDGRVILAELLEPRRKAFDKLDTDHNGQLSFQEWTVKTSTKFGEADADHNGILNAVEYATTAPNKKPKPVRCAC